VIRVFAMRTFWLVLVLTATSVAGGGFAFADQENALSAGGVAVSEGKGDSCVGPTPVMRREHMGFLLEQRSKTMHQGIRTERYSLKKCIECHVQKDKQGQMVPVDAPGQFCRECHQYAAVNIDCFQCHIAIPDITR